MPDFMRSYEKIEDVPEREPGGFQRVNKKMRVKKKRSGSIGVSHYMKLKFLTSFIGSLLVVCILGYLAYTGVTIFLEK